MAINEANEDDLLSTEIIWQFANIHSELVSKYPNGECLSEELDSIDKQTKWRIQVFPNGKTPSTQGKLSVLVTLIKSNQEQVLGESFYRIVNRNPRQNYVGELKSNVYKLNEANEDSSFDNDLFKECEDNCALSVQINHSTQPSDVEIRLAKSAQAPINQAPDTQDEDFKKVSVKNLY
jgi:hypothetical protein